MGTTTATQPAPFLASLPEGLRGNELFKDVKDVGDLATRYVGAATPKPFAEQLPKEIAGEAYFKDVKDVGALATRAFHQSKMLGKVGDPNALIVVPGEGAKPQEWDAVYTRLGRPEKADGYQLAPPQGREWSEGERGYIAFMTPVAHKLGLNQAQLNGIAQANAQFGAKLITEKQQADTDAMNKAATALHSEWGDAFDQKVTLGNNALGYLAQQAGVDVKQLNDELDRGKLGNRPALAKILATVGQWLEEDGILGRAATGAPGALAPAEARQQIAALEADPTFKEAWTNKSHPKHAEMVERRSRLYAQAYPAAA